MSTPASFGSWLKQRRKVLGLTQERLADRVGCSVVLIRKLESAERHPSRQIADRLRQALDIAPAEQAAFLQLAGLAPDALPPAPPSAPSAQPPQLPTPLTPLIGREAEVRQVQERLLRPDVRLLCLVGPPGIGKTRLALATAWAVQPSFPTGVAWVSLAAISSAEGVLPAIAQSLGLKEVAGQTVLAQLSAHLRSHHLLLVLDNFEHVATAAPQVSELLQAAPELKVLVTSRTTLRLHGEHAYQVPPLALPPQAEAGGAAVPAPLNAATIIPYGAVAMFVDRVQAITPDWELTDRQADVVAAICARLDGLPLAIELAAARTKVLGLDALLQRLDQRLPILTRQTLDLPSRQQTLHDAIDWSYQLLQPATQAVFRSLAVFIGGCTLLAAETIYTSQPLVPDLGPPSPNPYPLSPILDSLEELVDHSLVRYSASSDGQPRFGMLETIREYALLQLSQHGEADVVRQRHARFFVELAEHAEQHFRGPDQAQWFDLLEQEHPNLRAALSWALAQQQALLSLRLGGALHWFWYVRGHLREGRDWLARVVHLGQTVADDAPQLALALRGQAMLCFGLGDYAEARSLYEQALLHYHRAEEERNIGLVLNNLGLVVAKQGDYAVAQATWAQGLHIFRQLGDAAGISNVLINLGNLAGDQADFARARSYYEESLQLSRALGNTRNVAAALGNLGDIAVEEGDTAAANTCYRESLATYVELGDKRNLAIALENLARLASLAQPSDGIRAARLYSAAGALRTAIGSPLSPAEAADHNAILATIQAQLGEAAWATATAQGRVMGLEAAIAEAMRG